VNSRGLVSDKLTNGRAGLSLVDAYVPLVS